MKPLTTAEVRAEIARLPAEHRASAERIAFSAWDDGLSGGLANMARKANPFLPPPAAPVAAVKGKAR